MSANNVKIYVDPAKLANHIERVSYAGLNRKARRLGFPNIHVLWAATDVDELLSRRVNAVYDGGFPVLKPSHQLSRAEYRKRCIKSGLTKELATRLYRELDKPVFVRAEKTLTIQ